MECFSHKIIPGVYGPGVYGYCIHIVAFKRWAGLGYRWTALSC